MNTAVATRAPRASSALLALQWIKTNAQFAMAGGALFDLQRCVEHCGAATASEANLLTELRDALSFIDEAVARGCLDAGEVAEQFADARALIRSVS
jgi:hypothetical protein